MTESQLAGEVGKAPQEQGTSSKGGTNIVFIVCLGLLLNSHVIAGPTFLMLQCLGVT